MARTLGQTLRDGLIRVGRTAVRSLPTGTDGPIRLPDLRSVGGARRRAATTDDANADRDRDRMRRDDDGEFSPGQLGPTATVEVPPAALRHVDIQWSPRPDGHPDPGEVVWTWVPYEEADGRGKDRPTLVVGRQADGHLLAVQLSSRDHRSDGGWALVGRGGWDRQGRESWANLGRILRIHPDGMRREGDVVDHDDFTRIAAALERLHGPG